MFGNVSIGKDTSGNYKLWPGGVAVRTSGSEYVGYDQKTKGLIDVTGDVIGELDFIYKAPVPVSAPYKELAKELKEGDLLLVKDGPTPDVLFVVRPPVVVHQTTVDPMSTAVPPPVIKDPSVEGFNPRTFRSEKYVPPKDSNGEPVYIRVFSPLTKMLANNPLLQFMLAKGEGGHDSHALAALLYHDLDQDKLKALTPVFVSEKGLSSELLSLRKLLKEV
jgi:hypothetical protein